MKNLDVKSKKFEAVNDMWDLIDTINGGTKALRAAGERYLPKEPKEVPVNYEIRLRRSTFFNAYSRTVTTAVGKVFSRDVIVESESDSLLAYSQDVDLAGQNLTQFAQQVFRDGVDHGISFILTDYPPMTGQPLLRDEQSGGRRPYWVNIKANQVLEASSELFDGVETLTRFRYIERNLRVDNTGKESVVTTVRVLKFDIDTGVVSWEKWIPVNKNAGQIEYANVPGMFGGTKQYKLESEWEMEDSGVINGVYRIPIAPFYANRTGFFIGTPPLMDLAEKNIEYWQSYSDQQNILHIARVPMLQINDPSAARQDPDEDVDKTVEVVSANSCYVFGDKDGNVKWVETTGKGVEVGRDNIQDIKDEMAVLGLELYVSRPGAQTATAKAIDSADANGWLKSMALSLKDCLEASVLFMAQFAQIPVSEVGEIIVNTEYSIPFKNSEDMKYLLELYTANLIDASTVLTEAKRRNLLDYQTDVNKLIEDMKPVVEPPTTEVVPADNINDNNNNNGE